MAGNSIAQAVFITIPLSHYCEKARWALDRAGLSYREEPHAPLFHRLVTMRRGGGTVPVLLHGSRRFVDSNQIVGYAEEIDENGRLYPPDPALRAEVDALTTRFDHDLGPHTRRWAYEHILTDKKLLRSLWTQGVPRVEATLLPLIVPAARRLVRRAYRISHESARRSLDRVHGVFQEVDQRLSDGREFLVGNRFTVADLTFAALAAPAVFPAENQAVLPALEQLSAAMREDVARLRTTEAGRFALRLYEQQRTVLTP